MSPSAKSLSLFPEENLQPAEKAVDSADHSELPSSARPESLFAGVSALWLCLEFPYLSLEIYGGAFSARLPVAVVEESGNRSRLLSCNPCATALGIRPHMTVNAAIALAPDLHMLNRDEKRERRLLERLAAWTGRFSSLVSLEPPNALLLEVKGSLRLFGGLDNLCKDIFSGLGDFGYEVRWACAPTPLASLWLARAASSAVVTKSHQLPGALGRVPLVCLRWPEGCLKILRQMGIEVVADCLRLPRDGFSRRLGSQWLEVLDRAMQRRPDPRRAFESPTNFEAEIQLLYEVQETASLLPVLRGMLEELQGVLVARQAGVQKLHFYFCHLAAPDTCLRLNLMSPSRSAKRFATLLELKLETLTLASPVVALRVKSENLSTLMTSTMSLFTKVGAGGKDFGNSCLVERLRARLGVEAVRGIGMNPEHRPEAAWRFVEPGAESKIWIYKDRPLWMLVEPRRLSEYEGQPCYQGRLILESGPERIETGWWDGRDVARDYFVARHDGGRRFWLFRERKGERYWYLHGAFG